MHKYMTRHVSGGGNFGRHFTGVKMMNPTLYFVPCFSGSPWDLKALTPLDHRALRTARLPEALDRVEAYADAVEREIRSLSDVVLVGEGHAIPH
ncbi:MAG: hypothetical protein P4L83_06390 [Nevskia sp.]|nr:hypothetical protein [Nevskia sp.]